MSHRWGVYSPQVTSVEDSFSSSCESCMEKSVLGVSTLDGELISLTIRKPLMVVVMGIRNCVPMRRRCCKVRAGIKSNKA